MRHNNGKSPGTRVPGPWLKLFCAALLALLMTLGAHPATASPVGSINGIRIHDHKSYTRFVIDLDLQPNYRIFLLRDPYRVVVDLPEVNWSVSSPQGGSRLIRELRYGLHRTGNSRLVLDVLVPVKIAKAFTLPPQRGGHQAHRLILDLQQTTHTAFMRQLGRPIAAAGLAPGEGGSAGTRPQPDAQVAASAPASARPAQSRQNDHASRRPLPAPPPAKPVRQIAAAQERSRITAPHPLTPPRAGGGQGYGAPSLPQQASAYESYAAQGSRPGGLSRPGPQVAALPGTSLPLAKPVPGNRRNSRPLVMLDPGHGGIDPGAIGRRGTKEKDVTLRMARELRSLLESTGRYRVKLTRDSDEFIALRERVHRGRAAGADLFISLHADSIKSGNLRGLSVYTLSETASDKEAEMLAQKENKADLIADVDLSGNDKETTSILIDLAQRETMNYSLEFADFVVKEVRGKARLLNTPKRSAGFAVLKAPDVPSVLIEIGFLSSPAEERLLNQRGHRKKIAQGILEAIDDFFSGSHRF